MVARDVSLDQLEGEADALRLDLFRGELSAEGVAELVWRGVLAGDVRGAREDLGIATGLSRTRLAFLNGILHAGEADRGADPLDRIEAVERAIASFLNAVTDPNLGIAARFNAARLEARLGRPASADRLLNSTFELPPLRAAGLRRAGALSSNQDFEQWRSQLRRAHDADDADLFGALAEGRQLWVAWLAQVTLAEARLLDSDQGPDPILARLVALDRIHERTRRAVARAIGLVSARSPKEQAELRRLQAFVDALSDSIGSGGVDHSILVTADAIARAMSMGADGLATTASIVNSHALLDLGQLEAALSSTELAETNNRELQDPFVEYQMRSIRMTVAFQRWDTQTFLSECDLTLELGQSYPEARHLALTSRALFEAMLEQTQSALVSWSDVILDALETGSIHLAVRVLENAQYAYRQGENWPQVLRYARRVQALARRRLEATPSANESSYLRTLASHAALARWEAEIALNHRTWRELSDWMATQESTADPRLQLMTGLTIAHWALRDGSLDSAQDAAEQVVRAAESSAPDLHWRALAILGNCRSARSEWTEATESYEAALRGLESMRTSVSDRTLRARYLVGADELVSSFVVAVSHADPRPGAMFDLDERARARTLLDRFGVHQKRGLSGLNDVQATLECDEILVKLRVDPGSLTHWAVSRRTAHQCQHPLEASALAARIDEWRQAVESRVPTMAGDRLYGQLFGCFELLMEEKLRLIVVPDGPIWNLPFGMLPRDGSLLLERFLVRVSPSASLMVAQRRDVPRLSPTPIVLSVGFDGRGSLRLTSAELEALAVAKALPGSQALVGERASLAETRSRLVGHDVLHVASHASPNSWGRLVVHLAPGGSSDGLTDFGRFGELSFDQTRTVVFTSCQAGARGGREDGDLAGLSHVLLGAGARRVIASPWKVNDLTSSRLWKRFYRELAAGQEPASALRQAQLSLLADSDGIPVGDWGVFCVYGE